jgi:hypothetical protein
VRRHTPRVRSDGVRKYEVTFSSRGERADDEPIIMEAFRFKLEGDFFAFYNSGTQMGGSPVFVVRASDVREIREVSG